MCLYVCVSVCVCARACGCGLPAITEGEGHILAESRGTFEAGSVESLSVGAFTGKCSAQEKASKTGTSNLIEPVTDSRSSTRWECQKPKQPDRTRTNRAARLTAKMRRRTQSSQFETAMIEVGIEADSDG